MKLFRHIFYYISITLYPDYTGKAAPRALLIDVHELSCYSPLYIGSAYFNRYDVNHPDKYISTPGKFHEKI